MNKIKINLFDLIDEEKKIRSWLMASGEDLNDCLKPLIEKASVNMGSKKKLTTFFQTKFNIFHCKITFFKRFTIKYQYSSNLIVLCPNHHWEFDNNKLVINKS